MKKDLDNFLVAAILSLFAYFVISGIFLSLETSPGKKPDPRPLVDVRTIAESNVVRPGQLQRLQDSIRLLPDSFRYCLTIVPEYRDETVHWNCDTVTQYAPISFDSDAREGYNMYGVYLIGTPGLECSILLK